MICEAVSYREGPEPGFTPIPHSEADWGRHTKLRSGVSHRQDQVQQIRSSDKNQRGGLYLGCRMKCSKIIKGTAMTHGFGAVTLASIY